MSAKKAPNTRKLRGVLIQPSDKVSAVEVEDTLRALWDIVGGYAKRVALVDGADLFLNEDSRLGLSKNARADDLVSTHVEAGRTQVIFGTALVLGAVDASGETTDAPDWVFEHLGVKCP